MSHPISTFARFMYLNAYAFLLLLVGIGIAFFPGYRIGWWLEAILIVVALVCLRGSWRIFFSWKDKKRKYDMLMQRNAETFRPDTFTEFMQAPCGRLLIRLVLKDMGCPERYAELVPLRKSLKQRLSDGCRPQKTVIYINDKAIQNPSV